MKSLLHFLKTTMLGGVMVLVPLAVLLVLLDKVYKAAAKIVQPVVQMLPHETFLGEYIPRITAILLAAARAYRPPRLTLRALPFDNSALISRIVASLLNTPMCVSSKPNSAAACCCASGRSWLDTSIVPSLLVLPMPSCLNVNSR